MKAILPKIRFNEFENIWTKSKLGELYEVYSGNTPSRSDNMNYQNGEIPWIKTTDLNNSIICSNEEKISLYGATKLKLLPENSVLIAMYGGFNQIGRTGLLAYPATINQALAALMPVNEINPNFLLNFLNFKKESWRNVAASSRKDPNITKNDVEKFIISFPSLEEQSTIGSLFHTLDGLLASYKDNLANYQSLKATMLSKMFPKAGQTVPEIRLDGFEGEWEINKLNKYLTVSKKKNTQQKFAKEDVLSVSGEVGIVNQIQFQGRSFAGVSVEMYSIVDTGNIVYTKSPLKANPYGIIKTNYGIPGIVSTLYAVYLPNENVFPGFVERYFENDLRLNSYLKPLVNKGAKNDMKVSDENALLGNVIFPKLEEQVAISDYFTNLDKFIQSHKDKISQLETLKKKLLQDMFI